METDKIRLTNVIHEKPIKTHYGLLIPVWYLHKSNPLKIHFKNSSMRFYEKDWGDSLQINIKSQYYSFLSSLRNHIIGSSFVEAGEYSGKLRCLKINPVFIWGKADSIKHLKPDQIYFGDVIVTLKHVFVGEKGATATWIVNEVLMPTKNHELSYFAEYSEV